MKPIKTDLFTLCDYATVSREQKLSVIGIFDQFFVANVPTNWPKMFLVAVVSGEPNQEYPITLKIIPPAKTEQQFPDKDLQVTLGNNGRANLITELVNFPLPIPGVYKVQILSEKSKISELEFKVNKTTATYDGNKVVN
ncbi:hypothetical protein A2870_04690 [Candidatus Curtissbacteria bacterium RIFCSPHIGHO2_01_FULL_41_11]|uniref:Uncharacterized protein n=1 Tax=Candidatus Curtissbacteria bacterium RIFCSPHIGHO2_01_FULL_41_11 TaxID=1797711 RepID=A0A1F5G7B3_9BACT|nr:MAG: hypothetical protein A2870_04690 [Candidatus Curtissbacteria bacterium RIFCSPHIGHO2_01_FULL_41_11]